MLFRRLLMASVRGTRPIFLGDANLYQGLWVVPEWTEPPPLSGSEEMFYQPHLLEFDGGIMRSLGMIGEWYTVPEWEHSRILNNPSSLELFDGGIVRILGMIGEWYITTPPPPVDTPVHPFPPPFEP